MVCFFSKPCLFSQPGLFGKSFLFSPPGFLSEFGGFFGSKPLLLCLLRYLRMGQDIFKEVIADNICPNSTAVQSVLTGALPNSEIKSR